jgi:hypothetical protein
MQSAASIFQPPRQFDPTCLRPLKRRRSSAVGVSSLVRFTLTAFLLWPVRAAASVCVSARAIAPPARR